MMDPASHYPEPLEEAFGRGAQRVAQLAAIVTAAAQVYAQYRAHRARQQAARDEQTARTLREQERAANRQARMGWAPAHDPRWLAQAGLLQAARVWGAAAPYAEGDPVATSALRKCEDRLRALHPYAMARYDRLRADGMNLIDAMREAVPLFAREPSVRTGEPGVERSALDASVGESDADLFGEADDGPPVLEPSAKPHESAERRGRQIVERLQDRARAVGRPGLASEEVVLVLEAVTNLPDEVIAKIARPAHEDTVAARAKQARASDLDRAVDAPVTWVIDERTDGLRVTRDDAGTASEASADAAADRTAAQVAAESFPVTAADAVATAAAGDLEYAAQLPARTDAAQRSRRPGRSV